MYTQEERQQVEQLKEHCEASVETIIKQLEGGYLITHVTRYVSPEGIVQGQTMEQYVACTVYDIHNVVLDKLYPAAPPPRPKADRPN